MQRERVPLSLVAGAGLLTVMLLVITAAHQPAPPSGDIVPERQAVTEFVYGGWDFALGETRDEIVRNLGEPLRITTTDVQNRHNPDQTDHVYELFYHGLTVTIYKVTDTGQEFLTDLCITSDTYSVKWGLHVGAPREQVVAVLGEPSGTTKDSCRYETPDAPSSVTFHLRKDRIEQIDWHFFLD